MSDIKPCACGNSDPIVWLEDGSLKGIDSMLNLEKIQCDQCGRTVWAGDQEGIDDWNNQRYDDGPETNQ